jgi:hypothetical protein
MCHAVEKKKVSPNSDGFSDHLHIQIAIWRYPISRGQLGTMSQIVMDYVDFRIPGLVFSLFWAWY